MVAMSGTRKDGGAGEADANGWMPIESAPKDGTIIDVFHPTFGRFTDVWWDDGMWIGSLHDDDHTHWRPVTYPVQP